MLWELARDAAYALALGGFYVAGTIHGWLFAHVVIPTKPTPPRDTWEEMSDHAHNHT